MNDEKEKDKYINKLLEKIEDLETMLKNKNEQIENERNWATDIYEDLQGFRSERDFWMGKFREIEKR